MKKSEIVNILLFDYDDLSYEHICEYCTSLDNKIVRWLGVNHPDNRTRKIFFTLTGVTFGADTIINPHCIFVDDYAHLVTIGQRCAISPGVRFIASSNPNESKLNDVPYVQEHLKKIAPIVVHDDVWIGTNAILLPGITVREKAVIGANAVVCADVPKGVIVAGSPAKIIRKLQF